MKTASKKIRIAALLLALAVGLLVRQGQKSSATEGQSSAANLVRAVAHLNLRRALNPHPNVTASNTRKTNPQEPAATKSQKTNRDESQENAVSSDSRPRNETRANVTVGPEATGKEEQDEHWILFLFLRMRNDTVELIGSSRSQGVLKGVRNGKKVGPIDYDLVTATGEPIWSENMEDPLIERTEFPVAENTVELKKAHFKLNQVEFTLRVPWKREACQLQFYRRQLIESPAGQQVDRRPLSSLTLPSYERRTLMKLVQALTRFAFFVFVLMLPERAFCETTIQQILTNGPTDKRINIVIFSEGYTAAQLDQFPIHAERYLYHLLATPPFDEYSSYFNAFIISVASAESGSDHPQQNDYRDTYFNTSYGTGDMVRLMSIPYDAGREKVNRLLRDFVPGYDLPILLVNDDEYGGAGGTTTIVSRNSLAADAAVHELGHTLAHLDDEYSTAWSGADSAERANSTRETRREFMKWRQWIDDSTPIPTPETSDFSTEVGLFEGAHYHGTGWYRPKYNCKMNTIGSAFCEVCKEALVLSFYDRLNPIDSFSPLNPEVKIANEPVVLSVEPLQPDNHTLDIQWFIDKTPIDGATSTEFVVSAESLAPGTYEVVAEVRDATPLVRADPWKQLIDSHSWRVTVTGEPVKAPTPVPTPDLVAVQDSNGNFVINLTGPLGSAYIVQTTSDFVTWEPLATVTNATGTLRIFDPAARQQSLRFYRAVAK